jgi:putative tryptophan/tyrosine transport system substrate-binding protein
MKRREFIKLCGSAAMTWPVMAHAQQMPTIGLLGASTAQAWAGLTAVFHQGLGDAGYTEGRNVAVEYRWAGGQYERLAQMADDLVRHPVSALVAFTTPAALAAKAATTTTPIVFTTISDPVQTGLVTSLSRPDGNMTGITYLSLELASKHLELMREAIPTATSVALLINPTNAATGPQRSVLQAAARTLGIDLHVMLANSSEELDAAFEQMARLRIGGLVLTGDPFLNSQIDRIAALALRNRLPSIYPSERYPAVGGLMSYAGNAFEAYRQAGIQTGRILRGEKPANLPVQQVTKVELIINLKTAKAFGISLPLALLGRADEIIE